MQQFRTEITTAPSSIRFKMADRVLTQGSCFADAIGNRLSINKLKVMVNPFGVIYNPESIHRILMCSVFNEPLPEHSYLVHQDIHLNYHLHSRFSALKKGDLTSHIVDRIGSTHYFLKDIDWLLLTYGTAWSYQRKDTGEVVANCHKMPTNIFAKALMTEAQIVASFKTFYDSIKKYNPKIKIILTVSPVRHLKETMVLNSVSKSVLRVACHSIVNQFDSVDYFPAYEMMMDDLRDYRFYKSDRVHPTVEAEDYIWEKFGQRYLDEEVMNFINSWNIILSGLQHRPFHPNASSHQQFLKDMLKKLEELKSVVNVEEEEALIRKQIVR